MTNWNREVDVAVLGTGAAGLAAALAAAVEGASVALFEKASTLGGTTATSGGIVWVPAHDRLDGVDLPAEDAVSYLRAQSRGSMDEPLVEAFVEAAPRLLDFLEQHTRLRFSVVPGMPDTQPELPGGRTGGGRSFFAEPLESIGLEDWEPRFAALPPEFSGVGFDPKTGKREGGHGGTTLVAGILEALLERGVVPELEHGGVQLITEGAAVAGVRVAGPEGDIAIRTRGGVVLATGGFEWDSDLVQTFLSGPMQGGTSPEADNAGDGLRMAMTVGAELGSMKEAWWVPIVKIPMSDGHIHNWGFLFERTRPRSIMVNRFGKRFVNEATASSLMNGPFHELDPQHGIVNLPSWLIFDAAHFETYGAFGVEPGGEVPDWFVSGDDLPTLARNAGIDPDGLQATVDRWNQQMEGLRDTDFGRGQSAQDVWAGTERDEEAAKRTLGPIDKAPFYAVPATLGALGTKGGPRTDVHGQVRHVLGGLIPGLFAAGNAMAAVTGSGYGGPGGTLAMALVWGHRAGAAAARSTS